MTIDSITDVSVDATSHEPTAIDIVPLQTRLTDMQRDVMVKKALTRFVRNKNSPEDQETLRFNLITARVINGMLAIEAAERFGYANSTQLSLIESGVRSVPTDHKFLRQAAQVYSVSTDWLLGLSSDMEPGVVTAQRYALLRGTREAFDSALEGLARLSVDVANRMQLTPDEVAGVIGAIEAVMSRFASLVNRGEFDDLRGGAPVAVAVSRLETALAPLRRVRKAFECLNDYILDMHSGRLPKSSEIYGRFGDAAS